jgi:soluble lytic murein transglycosylase-like protein
VDEAARLPRGVRRLSGGTDRFDSIFREVAESSGFGFSLLKAQAIAESGMNPFATSPAGAVGLTQFMPATWDEIMGEDASPFSARHSIVAQGRYLNVLRRTLKTEDVRTLLAAYNWGPGNVKRHVEKYGRLDTKYLPLETQAYLTRIAKLRSEIDS